MPAPKQHSGFGFKIGMAILIFQMSVYGSLLFGSHYLWAAALLILTSHMSYTIMHDAAHNLLGRFNTALGVSMGVLIGVSYSAHKIQHEVNHKSSPHRPDNTQDGSIIRRLWEAALSISKAQYEDLFRREWRKLPQNTRRQIIFELALVIGLRVGLLFYAPSVFLFIFLSIIPVLSALWIMLTFDWLIHPRTHGELKTTLTYIFPKPFHKWITGLWMFQNYHVVHHLNPDIPFHQYRLYFEALDHEVISLDVIRLGFRSPIFASQEHGQRVFP